MTFYIENDQSDPGCNADVSGLMIRDKLCGSSITTGFSLQARLQNGSGLYSSQKQRVSEYDGQDNCHDLVEHSQTLFVMKAENGQDACKT